MSRYISEVAVERCRRLAERLTEDGESSDVALLLAVQNQEDICALADAIWHSSSCPSTPAFLELIKRLGLDVEGLIP